MEQGQNKGRQTNKTDRVRFGKPVWSMVGQHVDVLIEWMTGQPADGPGPVGGGRGAFGDPAGFLHIAPGSG